MSISTRWVERPNGVLGRAYETACHLVSSWLRDPDNANVVAGASGWSFVDLTERIAGVILQAEGYDDDLLESAADGPPYPNGWTVGDLDAELERTRHVGNS